ncbi:MAG: hypothetical protein QOJ02_2844 [Acidobacteriota bacterium]|nr:hypothetical protein [Acidobacteriota bacterium]
MSQNDLSSPPAINEERCPACGASVSGGRAGCQALFDALTAQSYSDPLYAAVYSLALDAYCMQHPESYGHSAKSYAAHLMRLCCGLEHDGDHKVYEAIQKWLNGAPAVEKPEVPGFRGKMTVADLTAARNAEEHEKLVREWAGSVWAAYATQHDIARNWITAALSIKDRAKTKR